MDVGGLRMARVFRRIKSPRETKDRQVTAISPGLQPFVSEQELKEVKEKALSSVHRRHKSAENIVLSVTEPSIFNEEEPSELPQPPELPPRNRETTSGSFSCDRPLGAAYRRTQSSGTMSASFKHAPRKSQDDYFVPADTLKKIASASAVQFHHHSPVGNTSSPRTIQDKRNLSMVEKIMTHNDPDFRASQKHTKAFDKLIDNSDYSVPFDILQQEQQAGTAVPPPPKPKRHTGHGRVKVPSEPDSQPPPNYSPPPPPPEVLREELAVSTIDTVERPSSVSPISPSVSVSRAGDYDDPWDSKKFSMNTKKLRQRAETDPLKTPHFDPYKSPKATHHNLSTSEEPPLPPKPYELEDHEDPVTTPSPTPPPVPESSRPRTTSTGESEEYYTEPPREGTGQLDYINEKPLHVVNGGGLPLHDYVNQPAFPPPQLPPRQKKKHGYSPLVPADISSPDIASTIHPPAFPIDISIMLEEQL